MIVDVVDVGADDPRLAAFWHGIYWDAFAEQHEPLDAWQRALRGECAHRMTVRLALDGDAILAGICFEQYPRSRVALVTYMVVAPAARGRGLGEQLLRGAVGELHAAGSPLVLGEVNDPARAIHDPPEVAQARLARFVRWGARVLDVRYIQPRLDRGLERDRGLVLVAFAGREPLPSQLPGADLRAFVDEFYAITEGGPPDPEIRIPDTI